jgi:hypothetical protein
LTTGRQWSLGLDLFFDFLLFSFSMASNDFLSKLIQDLEALSDATFSRMKTSVTEKLPKRISKSKSKKER